MPVVNTSLTVLNNDEFFRTWSPLTLENLVLRYDKNLLDQLIKNPRDELGNFKVNITSDDLNHLKKFKQSTKSTQTYKYNQDDYIGRVYHSTCIQFMRSEIRKTLLYSFYYDLDIKSCQPTLLYNLCKYHGLKTDKLKDFIEKGRETFFENGIKNGIPKHELKNKINCCLFTCSSDDPVLEPIANEISDNLQFLKRTYPIIWENSLKQKKISNKDKKLNKNNHHGTFLSFLLQTIENRIITIAYHELKKTFGINTGLILHDSLHIEKTKKFEELEKITLALNKIIKQKFFDFDITFVLKDFSNETLHNHQSLKYTNKLNEKLLCDAFYEFYKDKGCPITVVNNELYICDPSTNLWSKEKLNLFKDIFENEEFNFFLLYKLSSKVLFTKATEWVNLQKYFILDSRFVKPKDFDFDDKPDIIAFNNKKCIQLYKNNKTQTWLIRDLNPDDYCTMNTGYPLIDGGGVNGGGVNGGGVDKGCPLIPLILIKNCFQDDDTAETFLSILGSSIYGELLYKKFFISKGAGDNGRSFISNMLNKALGDYHGTFNADFFTSAENSSDLKNPEAIQNMKKRFITMNEPKASNKGYSNYFDTEKIKMYSGNDILKARLLNSNQIHEFINRATILSCLNKMLKISNIGGAERQRIFIIPQDTQFVDEPELPHQKRKLQDTSFINEVAFKNKVMFMLLSYWDKFVKNNLKLVLSQQILDTTDECLSDPIDLFLKKTVIKTNSADDFIPLSELYDEYEKTFDGDLKFIKKQKEFKETLLNKRFTIKLIDKKYKDGIRINCTAVLYSKIIKGNPLINPL